MSEAASEPDSWAIVELMGHLTRAGRISEVTKFGAALLRLDVPIPGEPDAFATELFGGNAVYRIRYCTEEIARRAAGDIGDPRPTMALTPRLPAPVDDDEDERPF